ncbi:hypothetical protein B0H12DRAFT_1081215 [Mycena haematopus]|nr:hypothetical protein B0H12DRAFT_1081215 [Mycena haematopus]
MARYAVARRRRHHTVDCVDAVESPALRNAWIEGIGVTQAIGGIEQGGGSMVKAVGCYADTALFLGPLGTPASERFLRGFGAGGAFSPLCDAPAPEFCCRGFLRDAAPEFPRAARTSSLTPSPCLRFEPATGTVLVETAVSGPGLLDGGSVANGSVDGAGVARVRSKAVARGGMYCDAVDCLFCFIV